MNIAWIFTLTFYKRIFTLKNKWPLTQSRAYQSKCLHCDRRTHNVHMFILFSFVCFQPFDISKRMRGFFSGGGILFGLYFIFTWSLCTDLLISFVPGTRFHWPFFHFKRKTHFRQLTHLSMLYRNEKSNLAFLFMHLFSLLYATRVELRASCCMQIKSILYNVLCVRLDFWHAGKFTKAVLIANIN